MTIDRKQRYARATAAARHARTDLEGREEQRPPQRAPGGRPISRRWCVALSGVPLLVLGLTACGSSGLSGSSTCADFLKASAQEQTAIVDQLAGEYHKPDYTSPLGAPEVPYFCASNPSVTLDQFFQRAGD